MEKILIMAYMGTGKTYLEKNYENIVDFDFQDYKYIYDESIRHLPLEKRKGSVNLRKENLLYPDNFLSEAIDLLKKGKIVVSPFIEHVFLAYNKAEFLESLDNVKIIIVCPERNNFSEYVERFKSRGNSEEFIKRREREFSSLVDLFEECENALKIIIKKGQYLSDVLEENNIIKKKKEYIKFKK